MCSDHFGVASCRDLLKELPPGPTPLFLASTDRGRAAADAEKPGTIGLACNERSCSSCRTPRTVIESGDGDFRARVCRKVGRGGEKHHRIESPADCEDSALASTDRPLDGVVYLGSFNARTRHDSFNLPVHEGVPLGDARSAGNFVGVVRPYRVLHRANLAEHLARHFPDAIADWNSGKLAARLAETPQGRAGRAPGVRALTQARAKETESYQG